VAGAASIAVAAAMAGIVSGGLIGGPVGTFLIERHKLGRPSTAPIKLATPTAANIVESQMPEHASATPEGEDIEAYAVTKSVVVILVAMWAGSWVSKGCAAIGLTLPAYIGAMLVAAAIRNVDDATRWFRLSQRIIDDIGAVSLSLFLVVALMTLKLWDLAGLALPLVSIGGARLLLAGVPADGAGLPVGRNERRLHRLHARHDGECHGRDAHAGRALRAGAPGVPGRAHGRGILY